MRTDKYIYVYISFEGIVLSFMVNTSASVHLSETRTTLWSDSSGFDHMMLPTIERPTLYVQSAFAVGCFLFPSVMNSCPFLSHIVLQSSPRPTSLPPSWRDPVEHPAHSPPLLVYLLSMAISQNLLLDYGLCGALIHVGSPEEMVLVHRRHRSISVTIS